MITYRLEQPLLGWAKGEHILYDPEWNEWTRQKTGETFNLRGSIGEGEKNLLLTACARLDTILVELAGKRGATPPNTELAGLNG